LVAVTSPDVLQPAVLSRHILILFALLGLGILFSPEISDSDFWWHLKTGEYIAASHALPYPDPFAFTTPTGAAEAVVRRLNLTHEWLAQLLLYAGYRVLGLPGVISLRVLLLLAFCIIPALVVYRRGLGIDRAIAAGAAVGLAVHPLVADRPYLLTFVFVAVFLAVLDRAPGKLQWTLPAIMLVWANSHGGFVMGLAILAVWLGAALLQRKPVRRLLLISGLTLAAAALNPNGFQIFAVLAAYQRSFLTSTLAEWQPLALWPPNRYILLIACAAAALFYARRRLRLTDLLIFLLFSLLTVLAGRNAFLIACVAPIMIATYAPVPRRHSSAIAVATSASAVAALAIAVALTGRYLPQFRIAEWAYPVGPARFLREHAITGRMFNTYEYGGYLIWDLWPRQRVFIDGRALSESVFADYGRILHYADNSTGKSARELLDQYGIDVILMNTFEYTSGVAYALAPALAESAEPTWQLVYADATGVIFLRKPPPGIRPIAPDQVFTSMEAECALHIAHQPEYPGCARALGLMYASVGEPASARRWLSLYLQHHIGSDPEAERTFLVQ
jgi:hypothetical protein